MTIQTGFHIIMLIVTRAEARFLNVRITFRARKAMLCARCLQLRIQILLVFEAKQ